jgi:prepilin-type processing-associated H-X9-DG protein
MRNGQRARVSTWGVASLVCAFLAVVLGVRCGLAEAEGNGLLKVPVWVGWLTAHRYIYVLDFLAATPSLAVLSLLCAWGAIVERRERPVRLAGRSVFLAPVIAFCAWVGTQWFPLFSQARTGEWTVKCLGNLKALTQAVAMYAADYDGEPPRPASWCDSLPAYIAERFFVCPRAPRLRSGYAYTGNPGAGQPDFPGAASRMILFESDRGWNASGGLELLPREPRHIGGDNYGFADGHAKWVSRRSALSEARLQWQPVLKQPAAGITSAKPPAG